MNIQLSSFNNKFSSYSIITERIGRALERIGIGVNFNEINEKDTQTIKLQWLSDKINNCKPDYELLILPIYIASRLCKDKYLYTMYESTEMPKDIVAKLSTSKTIITPSMFSATVISANGCKSNIFVAPLGCYTEDSREDVFKYQKMDRLEPFVFLIAYNPQHGVQRKGILQITNCFLKAFKDIDNVRLIIKTLPINIKLEIPEDKRITYVNKYMSDEEMYNLFIRSHCYINLATGGYELFPIEMLRCGRILISHKYGGVSEYITNDNTVLINDYYIDNAAEAWSGGWAYVKDEELIDRMLYVYKKRYSFCETGLNRSLSVKDFSWEKCAAKITRIMTNNITPSAIKRTDQPVTVVITTVGGRVDMALAAYNSAVSNGFYNIVIAGSKISKQEEEKIKKSVMQSVKLSLIPVELGRNECWLRGVYSADTEYVLILHDDDLIVNNISMLKPALSRRPSFMVWNAKTHNEKLENTGDCIKFDYNNDRYISTETIYNLLLQDDSFSISPVNGLFKKNDVINALTEFQLVLKDNKEFLYKDVIDSGNDMLLWLRISDRYKDMFYLNTPMVSYGHWKGSTTIEDTTNNKIPEHVCIYNSIKFYYLYGHLDNVPKDKIYYFVYNDFIPNGREDIKNAIKQWSILSNKNPNRFFMCPVSMDELKKRHADLPLPFINEIIDVAISKYNIPDNGVIVLSNNDVYPVDSIIEHFDLHYFTKGNIPFYLFRRDCLSLDKPYEINIRKNTIIYPGRDTFVFDVEWWKKHKVEYPEMLLGINYWDYILSRLIELHGGVYYQYLIYHLNHRESPYRRNDLAIRYNRHTSKQFLDWIGVEYNPNTLFDTEKSIYPKL